MHAGMLCVYADQMYHPLSRCAALMGRLGTLLICAVPPTTCPYVRIWCDGVPAQWHVQPCGRRPRGRQALQHRSTILTCMKTESCTAMAPSVPANPMAALFCAPPAHRPLASSDIHCPPQPGHPPHHAAHDGEALQGAVAADLPCPGAGAQGARPRLGGRQRQP